MLPRSLRLIDFVDALDSFILSHSSSDESLRHDKMLDSAFWSWRRVLAASIKWLLVRKTVL